VHLCNEAWVSESLQGVVDLIVEEVVCGEHLNVMWSCGGAKMHSGNEQHSIWSFALFCESHDDRQVMVRKELDKLRSFNSTVPQHDGERVIVLIGGVVVVIIIRGAG
jgi:hypothetical protein